ncbi:nuclear transport factor 2 family protein [Natronosalvus vescus]|uniref:nuclear transport factor 2 family protein n=1 Tax=Natronosalvus vescus TaxID=2953881 RepID=UPI002090BC93|nr:nuclear transport factor 2 family protein [Natronosalvus vescus]
MPAEAPDERTTDDSAAGSPETDANLESHIRRYYERVDAEDIEGLLELFAPDVTYYRPGQDVIDGKADLRAFYEEGRPLEDGSHDLEMVLVDPDRRAVAVRGRFSGVQGGESVEFGFADHHEFDANGLITTRHTYTDRDSV